MGQIIAAVVGAALILFILVWLFSRRGPKPKSRELAAGVWAAFGPYESAEDAERALRRSIRAVFGESHFIEHADWINGHAENFRMCEESGTLKQRIELMRRGFAAFAVGPDFEAACAKFRQELKTEALHVLDKITTDPEMEELAPVLRALIDGSMSPQQIREELDASQNERAERIVRSVGERLLNGSSDDAGRMREFLQELSREHGGEEAATPDSLGLLYLNCVKWAVDKPDSEFAKAFCALDDEWKATLPNGETT